LRISFTGDIPVAASDGTGSWGTAVAAQYCIGVRQRTVQSVANLTRQDGLEFFEIAPKVPVRAEVQIFPLAAANEALERLRRGKIQGAAVLAVEGR